MTGKQQSAAKRAFCSALAGQYKNAATAGVSALTHPKVLLTAARTIENIVLIPASVYQEVIAPVVREDLPRTIRTKEAPSPRVPAPRTLARRAAIQNLAGYEVVCLIDLRES